MQKVEMSRIEALKLKITEYPWKKPALKITEAEFDKMIEFIEENEELGHLDFEYKVNRMFLDMQRPKNFAIIQELLTVANSASFRSLK